MVSLPYLVLLHLLNCGCGSCGRRLLGLHALRQAPSPALEIQTITVIFKNKISYRSANLVVRLPYLGSVLLVVVSVGGDIVHVEVGCGHATGERLILEGENQLLQFEYCTLGATVTRFPAQSCNRATPSLWSLPPLTSFNLFDYRFSSSTPFRPPLDPSSNEYE